jgi:FtsZ-binding cell division protein ZapB
MAEELDALAGLEERVQQAVAMVKELRRDNEELRGKLDASALASSEAEKAVAECASLREEISRVTGELESLRNERKTVRSRVERILEQIDALGAG